MEEQNKNSLLDKIKNIENLDPQVFTGMKKLLIKIPVFLIVPVVYVILGKVTHLWHPLWLMFLLIPIHAQLCFALSAKTVKSFLLRFPIVFVAVFFFLCCGIFLKLWAFAWIVFLLIPLYYWYAAVVVKKK